MDQKLNGKKFAILATDGFEESELFEPKKALEGAGAEVEVVSLKEGEIKSWNGEHWGKSCDADVSVAEADASDYEGLVLPGGVANPDRLRADEKAVAFVQKFVDEEKPIAAICHGPWTLIETDVLEGRRVTSWPSLKSDLTNAGAEWVDEEVVTDRGLVTSRKPQDLPAFCKKMIEEFAEGQHDRPSMSKRAEETRLSSDR